MTAPRGLLCVHAHPDDESILTGGVLARASAEGFRASVVTCTGGEEGQIVGPGMDPAELRPQLADLRREELARALGRLGADPPRFLGYRDSGMMGESSNEHPEAFWQASTHEAVGRLVAHIRELRPAVFVLYDAFGGYGHPDHIQTHRVGLLAAYASGWDSLYPESGPAWRIPKVYLATFPKSFVLMAIAELRQRGLPSPFGDATRAEDVPVGTRDEEITTTVDVGPWTGRKWDALREHASQLDEDSFFLTMPEEMREVAFATEWFVRVWSDGSRVEPEDDLFAGLR